MSVYEQRLTQTIAAFLGGGGVVVLGAFAAGSNRHTTNEVGTVMICIGFFIMAAGLTVLCAVNRDPRHKTAEEPMSRDDHKARHDLLHRHLDELAADFVGQNREKRLSDTTIMELIQWSHQQTLNPTARN